MRADQTVAFVVMQNLKDLDGRRVDGTMRAEIARRISGLMPRLAMAHLAADLGEVSSIPAIVETWVGDGAIDPEMLRPVNPLAFVPAGSVPDKSVILNAMRWAADLPDEDVPRRPEILKQRLKDGTWSFTYAWPHGKRGAWRSAVDRMGEDDMESRIRFQMQRMGYAAFVTIGKFGALPWSLGVKVRPAAA